MDVDVNNNSSRREAITFSATGSEYFRIWIVNLLLSIVTLGIYSAWAKVRRNRYFYSSTHLAGGSFEYHGNAVAILKGRIAAVVLVGLLTFIAFIFINNTIRLSITARRREIAIMRLVGASNGFIRGPFITEGVLQAILGSLLSIGVLELLRNLMIPRLQESIGWMSFALPMQYYLVTYAALILVGVIIGLFGSAIAMRRYLRV